MKFSEGLLHNYTAQHGRHMHNENKINQWQGYMKLKPRTRQNPCDKRCLVNVEQFQLLMVYRRPANGHRVRIGNPLPVMLRGKRQSDPNDIQCLVHPFLRLQQPRPKRTNQHTSFLDWML